MTRGPGRFHGLHDHSSFRFMLEPGTGLRDLGFDRFFSLNLRFGSRGRDNFRRQFDRFVFLEFWFWLRGHFYCLERRLPGIVPTGRESIRWWRDIIIVPFGLDIVGRF